MGKATLKLDSKGIGQILKSRDMRAMVDEATEKIQRNVDAATPYAAEKASVEQYTTDRVASSVQVNDLRGMTWQAEDGVLSRAALSIGADFKDKK